MLRTMMLALNLFSVQPSDMVTIVKPQPIGPIEATYCKSLSAYTAYANHHYGDGIAYQPQDCTRDVLIFDGNSQTLVKAWEYNGFQFIVFSVNVLATANSDDAGVYYIGQFSKAPLA